MATTDVASKAIAANPIKNGGIVTGALPNGHFETQNSAFMGRVWAPETIESRYTNRFDEPRYYSGDTSG